MDERERYEAGMKVRRAVLGDAHVDASLAKRDGFSDDFQDLITRYAWGEIWSRPAFRANAQPAHHRHARGSQSRRRMRMHLRAALKNGVTQTKFAKPCCNPRSIVACPPQIPHFESPRKFSHQKVNSAHFSARL